MPVQTDGPEDYKAKYQMLKRKLKLLIYENECFQEELRKAQRALLRVRRDKSFLLDRLLQYQRGPESSTDSEQTEDSDHENDSRTDLKRRRLSTEGSGSVSSQPGGGSKPSSVKKKKPSSSNSGGGGSNHAGGGASAGGKSSNRQSGKVSSTQIVVSGGSIIGSKIGNAMTQQKHHIRTNAAGSIVVSSPGSVIVAPVNCSDGQMTREELERHLAARQPMSDFNTTVSLTVPSQLFSDNIMDGDLMDDEADTSPSNLEDDITIDNYD